MNEFYVEQLVPRKTTGNLLAFQTISMIVAIILVLGGYFLAMFLFVPAIIAFVIFALLRKGANAEYEYLFLNGEIEIDKIIAKKKRKHKHTVNMEEVVVIASITSAETRPFQKVKAVDYSSGIQSDSVYKIVYKRENQNHAILIEPNETLLNGLKYYAPRKVFI